MMGNNHKLDPVNVNRHTKIDLILSNRSEDIERNRNSDVNQGLELCLNFAKKKKKKKKMIAYGNSPKPDLVNVDVYTKFAQIL